MIPLSEFQRLIRTVAGIMESRGDVLRFAIAFALIRAHKLVRGRRQGLSEDEPVGSIRPSS